MLKLTFKSFEMEHSLCLLILGLWLGCHHPETTATTYCANAANPSQHNSKLVIELGVQAALQSATGTIIF